MLSKFQQLQREAKLSRAIQLWTCIDQAANDDISSSVVLVKHYLCRLSDERCTTKHAQWVRCNLGNMQNIIRHMGQHGPFCSLDTGTTRVILRQVGHQDPRGTVKLWVKEGRVVKSAESNRVDQAVEGIRRYLRQLHPKPWQDRKISKESCRAPVDTKSTKMQSISKNRIAMKWIMKCTIVHLSASITCISCICMKV